MTKSIYAAMLNLKPIGREPMKVEKPGRPPSLNKPITPKRVEVGGAKLRGIGGLNGNLWAKMLGKGK